MKRITEKQAQRLRWRFYFISLCPLFFLLSVKTIGLEYHNSLSSQSGILHQLASCSWKYLPVAFLLLALIGILLTFRNRWEWDGTPNPFFEISEITNCSFDYLTLLTTIIIPLACFSFTRFWDVVVLALLLVFVGIVFSKIGLFISNPTLAILNYKLYKIRIKDHDELGSITVITKSDLKKGSNITWLELGEAIWAVEEK